MSLSYICLATQLQKENLTKSFMAAHDISKSTFAYSVHISGHPYKCHYFPSLCLTQFDYLLYMIAEVYGTTVSTS